MLYESLNILKKGGKNNDVLIVRWQPRIVPTDHLQVQSLLSRVARLLGYIILGSMNKKIDLPLIYMRGAHDKN